MADFNPFAFEVIDISINGSNEPNYLPAPGCWVDRIEYPYFINGAYALGPVSDASIKSQKNAGIVTLGGFGGKIVLAFDHDVENNPANPMWLDSIVFSNAWPDPCSWRTQHWGIDDPCILKWPDFIGWPSAFDTNAFEIFPVYEYVDDYAWVLSNPYRNDGDPTNDHLEYYWGYAELSPRVKLGDRNVDDRLDTYGDCPNITHELFYTFPDDPYTLGIDPGSCGGDAFDISWAVDPCTWQPANLQSFRYIRITTAADIRSLDELWLNISAEIDAVSDVRPYGDINGDDKVDFIDMDLLSQTWLSEWSQQNFNPAADFAVDNKIDLFDYAKLAIGFNPQKD